MQLIFLRKSDCLGCAVLLCLVVCLTLLASSFLPSHLSLKHVQTHTSEQCHSYTYQVAMWNGELHKLVCVRVCIKMYNVVTLADAVYVLMK